MADTQRLLRKADWPQWYRSVTRRAQGDGIWDYCNPELSKEASATASLAAPLPAATAAVHRELIKPTRPLASEVNASATQIIDLDDKEFDRWIILKDDYTNKMKEYEEKSKAIADLGDYIVSTLNRGNHMLIRDCYTPYDMLKALKQRLEPRPEQVELKLGPTARQSARLAYESAQEWNNHFNLELWIRTYRNAFLEAKAFQPSLEDDYGPHHDFVRAIAQVDPVCSNALFSIILLKELSNEDPPDFITSCLKFFELWQIARPTTHTQY